MRLIPVEYIKRFPESGNRRHLKGGMELPVFLFAIWSGLMPLLAIIQVITLGRLWMLGIPVAFFLGISVAGQYMARQDPFMTEIYIFSLFYKEQYPKLARVAARILIVFRRNGKR